MLLLLFFLSNSSTDRLNELKGSVVFCARLTPSALGRGWPLIPRVRKGECVDRRLSHSLGLESGTASMKFLFSSLMLAWCLSSTSWGLSKSFTEESRDGKDVAVHGGGWRSTGWRKRIIQGQKVHRGWVGREREGRRCVVERERLKEKSQIIWWVFCCFVQFWLIYWWLNKQKRG